MIVDLVLGFKQSVGVNDVIFVLKDASNVGKFGDFEVDSNSIRQISSISTSSPSPTDAGGPQGIFMYRSHIFSAFWLYSAIATN